jgi:hypothetical protein
LRELSLHLLDVLENSIKAEATRIELLIEEDRVADRLNITIRDNGCGISEDQLAQIYDPFFTTRNTRRVGLGIPLFKAAAERCNGDLVITSQPGEGTTMCVSFQRSHIDRAPLGDIAGTLLAIILSGSCDLHYIHRLDERVFEFDTADLRSELEGVPLTHPKVCQWLQSFIAEGEEELQSSVDV